MTDFSPRRKATHGTDEPKSVTHAGFGRYYRLDADGQPTGDKMTRDEAAATGLPLVSARPSRQPTAAAPTFGGTSKAAPPEAPTSRRRRASVGGHALKLGAPERPGFKRRWMNDDGNRLANADELGYEFVSETGLKTSQPGSRVSCLAGTKASGEPLHTFLMETPDELYAEGIAEREGINSQVDQAIVKGADFTGKVNREDGSYGHGSITVER